MRRAYLGSDSVTYAENAEGRVYITVPSAPPKEGYAIKRAETVQQVEWLWKKLDEQERNEAKRMNEAIYARRSGNIALMKSHMRQRKMSVDCTQVERDFIAQAEKILDRKQEAMERFSVYGVAAMQESAQPLSASVNQVVKASSLTHAASSEDSDAS